MPILSARDIVQRFGHEEVLHGVSLGVEHGEILGLLGPSGAGKTTFVNVIAGVAEPVSGEVHAFGEPMPSLKLMRRMGYMAQSDALYTDLTASENLEFFGSLYGLSGPALKRAGEKALETAHLQVEPGKLARDYSGGMRRRLSLATAILHEPELLILDEPTIGLDPLHRVDIWESFRQMTETGKTLIVTTHVMDEAERCDRLAMIRDGVFIAIGTPENLRMQAGASTLEEAFLHFARMEMTQGGGHDA
ncbi:MAG: ABC transporter ATP-binding protein [Actinobacteria bacterium HGW-Actinobacteria-6]|jgi:ABC-2 type transport system ATP-binding protein|nr:MAG: ABC transporter ATP-binding protein [Actinobacteria bacterium HGW-Actinobacteria-6]